MRRGAIASCLLVLVFVAGLVGVRPPTAEAVTRGVWSVAASLITGREEHTATLLQDGIVLVTGGTDGRNKVLASAERSSAGKSASDLVLADRRERSGELDPCR